MRLMNLSEYPDFKPDIEFKSPVLPRLIATIVVVIFGIALMIAPHFPIRGFKIPLWWCYPTAALVALIRLLSLTAFRKSLRPTNWLLRSSGNRQWIKFRSFLNDHLPEADLQVIQLDRADVAWVRPVKLTAIYLSNNGEGGRTRTRQKIRCLDIGLNRISTAELDEQLCKEEQHPGGGSRWLRSKFNDYPVSVPEDGVIRLSWSNHYGRITPGVDSAIEFFARWTRTLPQLEIKVDYTPKAIALLSDAEQRKRLRELKRIDKMSATHAARELKRHSPNLC